MTKKFLENHYIKFKFGLKVLWQNFTLIIRVTNTKNKRRGHCSLERINDGVQGTERVAYIRERLILGLVQKMVNYPDRFNHSKL